MKKLPGQTVITLAERARGYYTDVLPYHNWNHAHDVMANADGLCDQARKFGAQVNRSLISIAAAWHDAAYHEPMDGTYDTKEQRSAALATRELPELDEDARRIVASAIIDTTVDKETKDSSEGVLLHFADVGYLAYDDYRDFLERLTHMRDEWGSPAWDETIGRTQAFAKDVTTAAQRELPAIIGELEAAQWIERVQRNINQLTATSEDLLVS